MPPASWPGPSSLELVEAATGLAHAEEGVVPGGEGGPGGRGLVGRGGRRPGDQPPGRPAALFKWPAAFFKWEDKPMMPPPTFYEGPLHDHEVDDLVGLLELVEQRLAGIGAEDLAGHVGWWVWRLTNVKGQRR